MRYSCIQILAITTLLGKGVRGTTTTSSPCGQVTDPCMDEENWQHCLSLEEQGCKLITRAKTCPLQFRCADLHIIVEEGTDDESPPPDDVKPTGCVSLFVYADKKCHGEPVRTMSFPTWTKPGSPCCKYGRFLGETIDEKHVPWAFFSLIASAPILANYLLSFLSLLFIQWNVCFAMW